MDPKTHYLKSVDLFRSLAPATLEMIDHIKVQKRYGRDEILHREGEPANDLWFVREGRVRSVRHLSRGQEVVLTMVGPHIAFGGCCCFSEGKYHCDTAAEVDSVVVRIPFAELKPIMRRHGDIALNLIENLSSRLHVARRTQTIDHESVEKRILYTLGKLREEMGTTLHLTKREIAEMAGTTVETCIRRMAELEHKGFIKTTRGLIHIRHLTASLKALALLLPDWNFIFVG